VSADAVTRLLRSAKNLDDDQGNFIASLRRVIDEGSWRDFTLESGFHHSFDTFAGFLAWVGVDRDEVVAVLRVRGEQALASAVLAEGIPPAAQHGGTRDQSQVSVTNLMARDSDNAYVVARLKRDDPDLAQQVINGTVTANAAAIQAGIRRPYQRVRTDNPQLAIAALLRHYTRDQLADALNTHQDT
jgi:hypothetical protein